jgi:hypothetical protein
MIEMVNPDNFNRAESDMYFGNVVNDGGLGKFVHRRELMSVANQIVIRPNRDTLYSSAVFDLDAGPVTITLPRAGRRFMSMQIIDEEQYVHLVAYDPGTYTLTRKKVGTRYALAAIRTLIDPDDPHDLAEAHAIQDAIKVDQKAPGVFEVPNWDRVSQKKVHNALLTLAETVTDTRRMFGSRKEVDPIRHLIGTAFGWGGNPEHDATYLNVTPARNDGETVYAVRVKDVPVDGFWSISVYNAHGYFERNEQNAYSVNSTTAKRTEDGTVIVQFGGTSDDRNVNVLPIVAGWNYTVRLYRPRASILEGRWTFPPALPIQTSA